MSQPTSRAPARELLEGSHAFPGEYLIKAFGPATEDFRAAIHAAACEAVGARLELSERVSSKGNSICITLNLRAETVDEVILAYERLHDVHGLRMIL
jgi:putative lipoic acid-binding regulatory protein